MDGANQRTEQGQDGSNATSSSSSSMVNNHAVIVSSSRYWFNYRHVVNALAVYQLCKANGIPDDNIILMLADDLPSNTRNPFKNGMYNAGIDHKKSLYDGSIEVDYRGEDVTVENMVRVLLGRQGEPAIGATTATWPRQRKLQRRRHLQTDENSRVLIYLTGHGGDQFFKFQDIEEIDSHEVANVVEEMHRRRRYKEILLVADTCQAFTLGDHITAPNVMVIGSSLRGESSYAHHSDTQLGLSVIERYTHAFLQFVQKQQQQTQQQQQGSSGSRTGQQQRRSLQETGLTIKQAMVDPYTYQQQRAHIGFRDDLMVTRDVNTVLLSDFFSNNENDNRGQQDPPRMRLAAVTANNSGGASPFIIKGWPSSSSRRGRSATTASSTRFLSSLPPEASSSSLSLNTRFQDSIPALEPSDGRFLALVAILLGVLYMVSRRS